MGKRLDLEGVDGTWCQPFHPLAHEYVSPLYPVSLLRHFNIEYVLFEIRAKGYYNILQN